MNKVCKKCDVEKSLSNYYKNKESSLGHENICKKCRNKHTLKNRNKEKHNKNAAVYRNKHREKLRVSSLNSYHKEPEKRKNTHYISRYGITLEDARIKLENQNNTCEICNAPISLDVGLYNSAHVDHNHKTGVVRGLLCSNCNTGIGLLQDSETILFSAMSYLKKYG